MCQLSGYWCKQPAMLALGKCLDMNEKREGTWEDTRHLLLEIKALLSVLNDGDKRVHIRIACNGTRKSPTW